MPPEKRNRREFFKTAGAGIAAAALVRCSEKGKSPEEKISQRPPNFVIIFTDDQGYGDMGSAGATGFVTPNLDRLAAEGLRFTDFYVAATVCTPSRAALLTGCYPKRVGLHEAVLYPYSTYGLHPDEVILPEILKSNGYRNFCVGKWHLGHFPEFMPLRQGFDEYFGVPYSNDMDGYYYERLDFQSPPLPLYRNEQQIESGPDQNTLTKRYTEESVRFIRANRDRPFFLYLAHSMPHLPLHASKEFRERSERGLYGDVLEEIDWSVGQILLALEKNGISENTLVIFSSDNGPVLRPDAGSAGPLRGGKGTTWDGGQRVPCFIRWPNNVPAGKICREMVSTMDILPTLAGISGSRMPAGRPIDGEDIGNLLKNPESSDSPHEAFFFYARNGKLEAVRSGPWKLHIAKSLGWDREKQGPFPVSLYNLDSDIGETTNLADTYPEVVKNLRTLMEDFDRKLTAQARPAGQI